MTLFGTYQPHLKYCAEFFPISYLNHTEKGNLDRYLEIILQEGWLMKLVTHGLQRRVFLAIEGGQKNSFQRFDSNKNK